MDTNKIPGYIFFFPILLFITFGVTFIGHEKLQHTPPANYRKTFDRTIECRQALKPEHSEDVDAICGKLPQWSDFNGSQKSS